MRLLVVTPRYPPDVGGVELHVYETSRRLAAAGVEVTVLTSDRTRQRARREQLEGVTVLRVPAWPSERDYYLAPDVYREAARGPWDLIHIQSWHTAVGPLGMLAASRSRIPFVVTPHGRGYASLLRRPLRPLQRRTLGPLLRRASRVIALARFERELLIEELRLSPESVTVIPNGSDLVPAPSQRAAAPDGSIIASVGRLERFKGHHRIIQAFPEILRHRPDARLVIVGEGAYEPALARLARRLGVADRVRITFFPLAEREALATFMSQASLIVLLSEYETHPIAALEAAALGKPVLVADVGGMKEFADDGLGHAVSLKSTPHELAQAALQQLEVPLEPGRVTGSSWDDCADELLRVYNDHARRP